MIKNVTLKMKPLTIKMTVPEKISIRKRTYFSAWHIRSAFLLADQSALLEKNYDGEYSEKLFFEDISYVTGTICAAVSFLEATVNEFLSDCLEAPSSEVVRNIDSELKDTLAKLWENDFLNNTRTLEKYSIILKLAKKEPFQKGKQSYQSADNLIKLRNELVHYKPKWIEEKPHKLEEGLRNKFPVNIMMQSSVNDFYPNQCLGAGCAKWACDSSLSFVESFYKKLGYQYPFSYILKR